MKKDGLTLLLIFAQGPLSEGACGDPAFFELSQRFLKGDCQLKFELREQVPEKLKTAWPALVEIAKKMKREPLDYPVVEKYVFGGGHNKIARPDCAVQKAKFMQTITAGEIYAEPIKGGSLIKLKHLSGEIENLKRGAVIYYHRGWVIGQKPSTQYTH